MKLRLIVIIALFLIPDFSLADDLKISAKLVNSYSTEYFGMVNVTFENNSGDWINVKSANVSFGSEKINNKVHVVTGEKLLSWNDGMSLKMEKDAFYTNLFLGTLASVSSGIAQDKGSKAAGVLSLGAASVMAVSDISSLKDSIDMGQIIPRTHLLYGNFSIPPGLSINRWILFNTAKNDGVPYLSIMSVTVELVDGKTITRESKLRYDKNHCKWQSDINPVSEKDKKDF